MVMASCLLKHRQSAASDAHCIYRVDESSMTITITALTGDGQSFAPVTLLRGFILGTLAEEYGIVAWDDDETGAKSDWTVVLALDEVRLRLRLVKQMDFGSRSERWAIELFPS